MPGTETTMTSTSTRNTWQRTAIRSLLANTEEFRTAAQIHAELRQVGDKVGLATVYRALQSMSDNGDLDIVRTPEGEAAYRMCSNSHHHHLVCRSCGMAVEIAGEAVENWANEVAQEHGFTDAGHNLEIFGLCRNCTDSTTVAR
ncbi:transcriptional repressor [Arachnia propionica]|uniref:Transcriptional repressor n=2 Tax=Arachnia propionica TaxID=1750 RepID=A0A3P1WWJ3_9ACTN|nr:transcriptional repressor [Arachnia propionica]